MDGYEEFLLTVRRDVNCLSDQGDKNTRRNAVARLEKTLFTSGKTSPEYAKKLFLGELNKPLFRLIADQSEKCRELAMSMTLRYTDLISLDELDNVLPLLLSALLSRLNRLPFPEQSEELRLEALKLLSHIFDVSKERLNPFASEILEAVSNALTDTSPDAKKECCEIVKKISLHIEPERVSSAGAPLVKALVENLKHQQWKVRRATLDSMGALLSYEETFMDHMEEVLPWLGALLGDRTIGVRQCMAEVLEKWLMKGLAFRDPLITNFNDDGPEGFAKFEHRLVLLLLSVAADEDTEQVAPLALSGLERVAARKHEALKASAEKARVKAKKMAEAKRARESAKEGADASAEPVDEVEILDPKVMPAFDYGSARSLLPEPFASGHSPNVLTSSYVLLHLPAILPQVLGNLTQWTSDIRGSAARLLRVMLVEVNRQVAPFLDQILVHLYKAASDDEPAVAKAVLQCAAMVGAFLDIDLVLGLVGKHLGSKHQFASGGSNAGGGAVRGVEEIWQENRHGRQVTRTVDDIDAGVKNFSAGSVENRRQVFAVLAHLLPPAPADVKPRLQLKDVSTVVYFLEEGSQSEDLLPWVFAATNALLRASQKVCVDEWPRIFDLLLRMRSGDECDGSSVDASMDILASLCGKTRRELYEEHLRSRLGYILAGADMELWDDKSPKRHVLETLLRNAGAATAQYIPQLVKALARQASPEDASVPARIDLLGLIHFLIIEEDPVLREAMKQEASKLLDSILIPNCTWRVGQSNNKIRKGGMICIHALLERHLIPPSSLNEVFVDLLPILKSGLDDSFSPDNRLIACLVLKCTLVELQAEINGEQLREIYPELLKRLDDSNDKIRVAICDALAVFFQCLPPKWSRSLFEYILRTLFVHLDDPSYEIQEGIGKALEVAAHQDYTTFIAEAKTAAAKSAHPRRCEELARLAESLRAASPDVDVADVDVVMDAS
jgi:dynein assembly factor 5